MKNAEPIQVLEAAHAARYKALMLHAYEHAADAFTSTVHERAAETDVWWLRRLADPDGLGLAFGAFDGDELVASAALEFSAKHKTRHKALIVAVYVLPMARGCGLARALMQAALARCRARGDITLVQLEVTQGNLAATRLYESLGFEAWGAEPMAVFTPGGYRNKLHMGLKLVAPSDTAQPASAGFEQDTTQAQKTMHGACLCGEVRWQFAGTPDGATACNCSACRRYGVLWAYGWLDHGIRVSGRTQSYVRGTALEFHFCANCGCIAYWRGLRLDADGRRRVAVNLRLAEPAAVATIPIDHFDGLDTFDDLPRDGRCVADYWF